MAPGVPSTGTRAVVFFVRPAEAQGLVDAIGADTELRRLARVAVVDSGGPLPTATVAVVADPGGRLARAYGMRRPNDGGYPVGYAVVDS